MPLSVGRLSLALLALGASAQMVPREEQPQPRGEVAIQYCMSWGYSKAYQDYARALHAQYPRLQFTGGHFHPGEGKMMLAQALQMVFFGGLLFGIAGRLVLPTGKVSKFLEDNQMVVLGGCFACNMIAGNLLNTGAFEIKYNGELIFSKIDTGRFPEMPELLELLEAAVRS